MAFGVILFGLLLYLPFAGTYGLWDPWETHYSEVARQMTYRGDFISLWWPGSPRDLDVFWSKPVLSFWLMSIGMHIARIGLPGGDPGEMALIVPRRVGGSHAVRAHGRARHLRDLPGHRAVREPARRRAGRGGRRDVRPCTAWWRARR